MGTSWAAHGLPMGRHFNLELSHLHINLELGHQRQPSTYRMGLGLGLGLALGLLAAIVPFPTQVIFCLGVHWFG